MKLIFLSTIFAVALMPMAAISQTKAASPVSSIKQTELAKPQPSAIKPMSRALKIGIAAAVLGFSLIVLYFSLRAWHASNLFDREYYFRRPNSVALRLGAKKSGGCMATISF